MSLVAEVASRITYLGAPPAGAVEAVIALCVVTNGTHPVRFIDKLHLIAGH